MKTRISEDVKLDVGLIPQALDNSNVTGAYHPLKNAGSILVLLLVGAMAATKTAIIELLQASDSGGTGAKGIPSTAGQLATATITANAKATKLTITLATFLATGTVTINDLVFTAHATTTTKANREFAIDGDDTADAVELAACINDPVYGVPGIKATSALGVVTLVADETGEETITASSNPDDATCVKATVAAQAYVEIDTRQIDKKNGFDHVVAKVTTTANTVVAVALLSGNERFTPEQQVGASVLV